MFIEVLKIRCIKYQFLPLPYQNLWQWNHLPLNRLQKFNCNFQLTDFVWDYKEGYFMSASA